MLGSGPGDEPFDAVGHTWPTQLAGITSSHPVTLDSIPSFEIPVVRRGRARLGPGRSIATFAVQILCWDPQAFPQNPEQWTGGLQVTLWSEGRATAIPFGTSDGLEIALETYAAGGRRYVRFPFTIEGSGD